MSSIEDFESRLPPELKQRIDALVTDINEHMDKIVRHEEKIDERIKQFISLCDEMGLPPEQTSRYIKHKLKGIVSDDTIERHLPEERKRKHKPYERYHDVQSANEVYKQPVTVASDGSQESEPESEPEQAPTAREVLETSTEIAMTLAEQYAQNSKELELRLNEALQLADDKDKRMHQLMMEIGEKEMVIEDLKKQPPAPNKDIDTTEDLQIEIDSMKQTITELQEALRANVKASGFTQASHLPKQVWIAAINAINFYRELNKASRYCIEHNDPWKKIIFEVASDGQLKAAKLDE